VCFAQHLTYMQYMVHSVLRLPFLESSNETAKLSIQQFISVHKVTACGIDQAMPWLSM